MNAVSIDRKKEYASHLQHKINAYKAKLEQCPKTAPLRHTIEKIVTADEARLMKLQMQFENAT
jgi:hypothetical protein